MDWRDHSLQSCYSNIPMNSQLGEWNLWHSSQKASLVSLQKVSLVSLWKVQDSPRNKEAEILILS